MADFATLDHIALRLGRLDGNALTSAQQAQGIYLLGLASALIRRAAGKAASWDPDPASVVLQAVCVEAVARVMTNPAGVRSESETLGQHQHSVSYPDGAGAIFLTEREMGLISQDVGGGRATTIPGTTVDLLIELRETGEIAAFPAEQVG